MEDGILPERWPKKNQRQEGGVGNPRTNGSIVYEMISGMACS